MLRDGYRRGRDQIRQLNRRTITAMNADKLAMDLVVRGVCAAEDAARYKKMTRGTPWCHLAEASMNRRWDARHAFDLLRANLSEADWRRALAYARRISKNHSSQQVAPVANVQPQTTQNTQKEAASAVAS